MERISVYDTDAKIIEKICDDNDMTECELIELLLEYVEQMKNDNGLR